LKKRKDEKVKGCRLVLDNNNGGELYIKRRGAGRMGGYGGPQLIA